MTARTAMIIGGHKMSYIYVFPGLTREPFRKLKLALAVSRVLHRPKLIQPNDQ